ncbi:HAD-like protein [Periconia macrospinosa]|uniref:HAD-like protein n=1 Tax=Periconia macrospinosa TaxID=97972 RepID=A0A2V1E5B8_9PLEO|nr:HAD-like protein [Periconia macrospinosa]
MASPNQKVIFFDLMGTCCDWLSSLLPALQQTPPTPSLTPLDDQKLRDLALAWRADFFTEIHTRFSSKAPAEDIDITHRRVLDRLLEKWDIGLDTWDDGVREKLVQQWHFQTAWQDVIPALDLMRSHKKWFLVVLANGTTRLQLDIAQSSGIPFHTLLSSELLGVAKPDLEMYRKAVELVKVKPENCYMLASHLYDLEAAKKAGLKTIYVHRTTEDVGLEKVDLEGEHKYVDLYFDGRQLKGCLARGFWGVAATLIQDAVEE